ncbi:MAG: hypothetical protein ACTTKQ_02690, partial [Filifactor alocis]|uniref:hypothetical protein n=1 Tax=Filifactor alocis TaxID=143361 RepID=UPI003FA0AD72
SIAISVVLIMTVYLPFLFYCYICCSYHDGISSVLILLYIFHSYSVVYLPFLFCCISITVSAYALTKKLT